MADLPACTGTLPPAPLRVSDTWQTRCSEHAEGTYGERAKMRVPMGMRVREKVREKDLVVFLGHILQPREPKVWGILVSFRDAIHKVH